MNYSALAAVQGCSPLNQQGFGVVLFFDSG
jgi:hypothetical protein